MTVYPIGTTEAIQYAQAELARSGVTLVDHPTPEVTHLLLDVPSFSQDGSLRGGGSVQKELERLPYSLTIAGGNLQHPALEGYQTLDLLRDPEYLAVNAAITADCAIRVAGREMKTVFRSCSMLVLGWGRIGKCLGQMLKALGCDVTIAARKPEDLAMIQGLGYKALSIYQLSRLDGFRVIFNTVPEMILHSRVLDGCGSCIKIDLASKPGMDGGGILWARGLPGVFAPESSGKLIADTFLRLAGRN